VEDRGRIPERDRRPSQPERIVSPVPGFHEVQRGDTLYSIAFRYGMDWREVADWNDIDAPYTIRPGQELRMTEPPQRPRPAGNRRLATPAAGLRRKPARKPVPEPHGAAG
jgi:lipoprotein NlpD